MLRIEKTVFVSYRRNNIYNAQAVYQYLTKHGYDVFLDYRSIPSDDFEQVILSQIAARAHFIIILTKDALKRCKEPDDWLRREIEYARETRRNIVPITFEGFEWKNAKQYLTGDLGGLDRYNGLNVPTDYFDEAMERLRTRYLNVPLDVVLHPPTPSQQAAANKIAAETENQIEAPEKSLSAEEWYQRGLARAPSDYDGQIADYTEAISLNPQYAPAYYNRGLAYHSKSDFDKAIEDYKSAIDLNRQYVDAYVGWGNICYEQGYVGAAIEQYNQAIRINPNFAFAYYSRALAHEDAGDLKKAIEDYTQAIHLNPQDIDSYYNRAGVYKKKTSSKKVIKNAIADYQKYLDLGGGQRDGDQVEVEQIIRSLQKWLVKS